MDTQPVTTVEAMNRTPLVGTSHNNEEGTFPQLGYVGDEVQKLGDPRLVSLIVKGSKGIHFGPIYNIHSKEESNKTNNAESLDETQCNEQAEMGHDCSNTDEEYEYILYTPSDQCKDAQPIAQESDNLQEFQELSLEPKVSETNNSASSYPNSNSNVFNQIPLLPHSSPFDANSFHPLSLSAPLLAQAQSSGKFPNVFFPRPEDNIQVLLDHRYEVVDSKKLPNVPKDRYEVQNIPRMRYEVKEPELRGEMKGSLDPYPKKFVENKGFRLGIIPGSFYKSSMGYFVELSNGTKYEILVGNDNAFSCDVDVYVDNVIAICLRLKPGKSIKIDGPDPEYSKKAFVFLKAESAPASSGIQPKREYNGVIKAVFLPEKVEKTRAMSEPTSYSRNIFKAVNLLGINQKSKITRVNTYAPPRRGSYERSIDSSQICEGASALQGAQSPKNYEKAEEMEVNQDEKVELFVRLFLRIDDLNMPSSEEISSLRPPPIWNLV